MWMIHMLNKIKDLLRIRLVNNKLKKVVDDQYQTMINIK